MAGDVNVNDSNERQPTTFFDLPPELRNRVYDMVIDKDARKTWSVYRPSRSLRLDQVNRQIRQESIARYWRATILCVHCRPYGIPSMRYLRDLGEVRIQCVRHFSFEGFEIVLAGGEIDTKDERVIIMHFPFTNYFESFKTELQATVVEKLQEENGWVYLTVKSVEEIAKFACDK